MGKVKTAGGLKKSDLMKSKKRNKIVSKKSHAAGLKAYKNIKGWTAAVSKARKELRSRASSRSRKALRSTRRRRRSTESKLAASFCIRPSSSLYEERWRLAGPCRT